MTDAQDRLGMDDVRDRRRTVSRDDRLAALFSLDASDPPCAVAPFAPIVPALPLNLRAFVERDVVPRLVGLGTATSLACATTAPLDLVYARAVVDVCDDLLASDRAGVCNTVETLRVDGCTFESIFLHVLAPAAARIRELWANDDCGYAEAVAAMLDLQAVLRRYAPDFRAELAMRDSGRRIMVASPDAPQDVGTAMFGLMMLSEFFRRDGWEPWIEQDLSSDLFSASVREQWFDVVELLVGDEANLDGVASGIKVIRRGSPNRSVGIVVCGRIFVEHPEFVRLVGADVFASDPRSSLIQARNFVSLATSSVRLT